MTLLDAITLDLQRAWIAFKPKWLASELEHLDRQIKKQESLIAECDAKIAARENRPR
jgi:hypothetical protein